ncbi:M20 family metallo-hydrolase [Clostridium sediminicola]|uniref:M20 family metallo-hydrolase n=1 Tax=Clostridium sediminicola TaxID=3114879 RepID=UPI0031F1E024
MLGKRCMEYLKELSQFNEGSNGLTRLFLTKEHASAIALITKWMENANMSVTLDEIGNLIGTYHSELTNAPTLMIGSHQDSVINGGIFDGMLGFIVPIVCVEELSKEKKKLPFNIKVVVFGSEEGTRFKKAYLSSIALRGNLEDSLLFELKDNDGITLNDALEEFGLEPKNIKKLKIDESVSDYLEMHIEQGPVLQHLNSPVGVVKAINGFRRYSVEINGFAGHAGTLPMDMRRDSLVGASEIITYIEKKALENSDLVATVGKIEVSPGAINVVPAKTTFTIDIRSGVENNIVQAVEEISTYIKSICEKRNLQHSIEYITGDAPCECNKKMIDLIGKSIEQLGLDVYHLNSGAGHDAQELSKSINIGMIFVRCLNGISHNPDESVSIEDLNVSAKVLLRVLNNYNKVLCKNI